MTELIVGSRRSGKTTALIEKAATDNLYILTGTKAQARHILDQAKRMGYDIPFPVTWEDFQRTEFRGSSIQRDGLLVDELEHVMCRMFRNIPIKAATWTTYDIRDLDIENPDNSWIGMDKDGNLLNTHVYGRFEMEETKCLG